MALWSFHYLEENQKIFFFCSVFSRIQTGHVYHGHRDWVPCTMDEAPWFEGIHASVSILTWNMGKDWTTKLRTGIFFVQSFINAEVSNGYTTLNFPCQKCSFILISIDSKCEEIQNRENSCRDLLGPALAFISNECL